MKNIFLLIVLIMGIGIGHAQKDKDLQLNEETNLLEATYYYDDGTISQKGTFNLAGKLHGEWTSFNDEGKKISVGSYENGLKVGKWFFWNDSILKEVEYNNNAIAGVVNTENSSGIVIKD